MCPSESGLVAPSNNKDDRGSLGAGGKLPTGDLVEAAVSKSYCD